MVLSAVMDLWSEGSRFGEKEMMMICGMESRS